METIHKIPALALFELASHERGGRIEGLADLFDIIHKAIANLATRQNLGSDDAHNAWVADKKGEFLQCMITYVTWARPTAWTLDFIDGIGSFGILFTGQHTCLVQMRAEGQVSGHS